ncbi:unnamed protein product, partial [Oikopleura dioica]
MKYLVKSGKLKTLHAFEESLAKKQQATKKLSFVIERPPKRKLSDIEVNAKKPSKCMKKAIKVNIPKAFKKLAEKVGLPKEHLAFFYENRGSFHWEVKADKKLHCTGNNLHCKFTTDVKSKALVQHMIDSHGFGDYPCDKNDCSYVAYSENTLRYHTSKFHGIGKRAASVDKLHRCKFSSCSYISPTTSALESHHRIHENRLLICQFCNVRSAKDTRMKIHLMSHFNIKPYVCDICSYPFSSNAE